jgi:hypothetical protein
MNAVPVRRRSVVSLVLGALAMAGSLAVMGVLVLSDVADAKAPRKSAPEQVASVEQAQTVTAPEPSKKPAVKKRARKQAKVDFGRFEGY